ncbi:DUF3895 domain-containing protein [Evansella sp. AB-rgal1]|uniref:DUF3895 domain-containing protein n=1 Tax=Evansella sp. AB-rgal1 TaxID=3242696 RepID=UPI00359EC890
MSVMLTKEERDEIFQKLSDQQKDFIQNHVKRGKKTVFANAMAIDKGMVLPDNLHNDELEYLLDEWVLADYIDNGFTNPDTPCECGRPLRYQYIVRHKSTNEVRRFGITHFEEHTGIPAEIVARIKSGFQKIDYELDELLVKVNSDWGLEREIPNIPDDFVFPKEMKAHVDADVPLLDRQVKRLKQQVMSVLNSPDREGVELEERSPRVKESKPQVVEPVAITLFSEEEIPAPKVEKDIAPYALGVEYRDAVQKYLEEGVSSARIITELLIKNNGAPSKRFSTSKPKIYMAVCFYLDLLVSQEVAVHIGEQGQEDRYYKLVNRSND